MTDDVKKVDGISSGTGAALAKRSTDPGGTPKTAQPAKLPAQAFQILHPVETDQPIALERLLSRQGKSMSAIWS